MQQVMRGPNATKDKSTEAGTCIDSGTTNDELWLLYRTTQASDIRRLEALQLWLMSAMAGSDVETLTREAAEADAAAAERREGKRKGRKKR